jgi:hypothetical protein
VAAPKHPTKKVKDLSSMSIDELWVLHETVAATLVAKMTAEKEVIEDRLRLLRQDWENEGSSQSTLANSAARDGERH